MITIGGVGPGNPKLLTMEVYHAIRDTDIVIGFGRVSEGLVDLRGDIIGINKVDLIKECIEKNHGKDILLLASGDPNFYGVVDYIKRSGIEIKEVLPGLSSFQYMMAKLKKPWQNANLLSLHGRDMSLDQVGNYEISIILTDRENNPNFISKKLKDMGIKGNIYVGYDLSYDREEIIKIQIGQEIDHGSILAVVVVENEMD